MHDSSALRCGVVNVCLELECRHCERSEAIYDFLCGEMDCFVACAPRNDGHDTDSLVMPGLDPGIHPSSQQLSSKRMDHRVEAR